MKKLVVLFPGVRYSCDTPLLYFAGTAFRNRGYEKQEIVYGEEILAPGSLEEKIQRTKETVLQQLKERKLSQYDDVVFVSKSIGTALAGWGASQLEASIRHIFLTPLEQTLPFIDGKRDVTIGAGNDEYLSAERLVAYCKEHDIPVTIYPGVGHRLEDKSSSRRTLEILGEIIEMYERFSIAP